jgi:hypothetical protein
LGQQAGECKLQSFLALQLAQFWSGFVKVILLRTRSTGQAASTNFLNCSTTAGVREVKTLVVESTSWGGKEKGKYSVERGKDAARELAAHF